MEQNPAPAAPRCPEGGEKRGVVTRNARQTGQNMDNAEPSHYNVPRMGDGHETLLKTASRHLKMTKYKLSAIALALMTSVPALAAGQADSKGFVADSSLDLFLRNAYMNRDFKHGNRDRAEWGQGAVLTYRSGFTQGVVGVGVDAFGQYAVRLDSGRGRAGAGGIDFFMIDNNGGVEKDVAHAGAAIKARFSNTVLSYG